MILLTITIGAIIAIILYFYIRQQRRKITGYTPYLEALTALLDHKDDVAMKKFKEAVRIDSDLIDAYIKLGDLYRKKGDISKAIQIHQSLTVRALLKKKVEKEVYYALVHDFLEVNRMNKAIAYLKEILKIDKNDIRARHMVLKIYEDMEDYSGCITVYEDRAFRPRDENRLAYYYTSLANNKLRALSEDDHEGKKEIFNIFKKALKISPTSLTAHYNIANYFERQGDLKKAKEHYLKIVDHHPEHIFLIIPQCEKVFFELGSFDRIISIYEDVLAHHPENFSVGFALADLYEKKNDIEAARDVYRRLVEKNPTTLLPRLSLFKFMIDDESIKNEIVDIEKMISNRQFRCQKCGYETNTFVFMCPKCHAIESLSPYL
jgi:lipopolysaccharide biosynthesis regulator YciM